MNATDWLNNLEAKSDAATPGPWIGEEGEDFDEDDVFITAEEREGMIAIARIERGSPDAGMDEPFQSEQSANATFISAANPETVKRLVWMIEYLADVLGNSTGIVDGKKIDVSSTTWMEKAYQDTEPKR